jgi:hypothetical protein
MKGCLTAVLLLACVLSPLQVFSNKERIANMPGVKQKSQYRQIIDQALQEQMANVPA